MLAINHSTLHVPYQFNLCLVHPLIYFSTPKLLLSLCSFVMYISLVLSLCVFAQYPLVTLSHALAATLLFKFMVLVFTVLLVYFTLSKIKSAFVCTTSTKSLTTRYSISSGNSETLDSGKTIYQFYQLGLIFFCSGYEKRQLVGICCHDSKCLSTDG